MKWKHVTSNEDNSLTSTTPRVNWSLARNGQSHLDLGSENQKAGASYGEGGGWSLPRPAVPPKGMEILLCYRLAQGAPDFTWFFLDCSLPAGVHQVALRHNDILQAVDKEKMSAKRKKMCCGLWFFHSFRSLVPLIPRCRPHQCIGGNASFIFRPTVYTPGQEENERAQCIPDYLPTDFYFILHPNILT